MPNHQVRDLQWKQTVELAKKLKSPQAAEPGSKPQPGEIYLSRRTAEFPVEWLVLATEGKRLQVVPVDDYPLVGSKDVELSRTAHLGTAVARCGLEAWTPAVAFAPELRTAVLEGAEFGRLWERREAVASGKLEPTLLEEVTDGDPEYQSWVGDTLRQAVEALLVSKKTAEGGKLLRFTGRMGPILALVAVLLVAVGLGRHAFEQSRMLEATQARLSLLESSQGDHAARIEAEAKARMAAEAETRRLDGQLKLEQSNLASLADQLASLKGSLRQALDFGVIANIPKLTFSETGGTTRGQTVSLQAIPGSLVLLEVEVIDPKPYHSYILRLVPDNNGIPLQIENLKRDGAWLRFTLNVENLQPGKYEIIIDGLGLGKRAELKQRYKLQVKSRR